MSRIGSKALAIPSGVTVSVSSGVVTVKGSKGELTYTLLPEVTVEVDGSTVKVGRKDDSSTARERHGLTRTLVRNMVVGVSDGYSKQLELIGVGYKAQVKGKTLVLSLGFSHPVDFPIPTGIEIGQDEKNKNILFIRGIDKQLVGQTASDIRSLRPPEPYKGKGIKYGDEQIRRKPGKAAVSKAA
jgi:large subunit ribosomal protein L6